MSDVKRNDFTKSLIGKIFGDVEITDAFYYVDQTSHSPFCRIKCLKCSKDRIVSYCNLQRQVGTIHGDQCRGRQTEHGTIYDDPKYQFAKSLIGKNYGDKRVYGARWDYTHQDYKCDTECVICGSKFTYSLSLLNKGTCNTHSNTCGSPKRIRQAKGNIYGVMKVLSVLDMDGTIKSEVECQECGQRRFVKTDNIVLLVRHLLF